MPKKELLSHYFLNDPKSMAALPKTRVVTYPGSSDAGRCLTVKLIRDCDSHCVTPHRKESYILRVSRRRVEKCFRYSEKTSAFWGCLPFEVVCYLEVSVYWRFPSMMIFKNSLNAPINQHMSRYECSTYVRYILCKVCERFSISLTNVTLNPWVTINDNWLYTSRTWIQSGHCT